MVLMVLLLLLLLLDRALLKRLLTAALMASGLCLSLSPLLHLLHLQSGPCSFWHRSHSHFLGQASWHGHLLSLS